MANAKARKAKMQQLDKKRTTKPNKETEKKTKGILAQAEHQLDE